MYYIKKSEGTKGVIRISKAKTDRYCNNKKKR